MTYLIGILLGIMAVLAIKLVHLSILMQRNNEVYRYRKELLDKIWNIPGGIDWRLKVYNSVSYEEMVNKFWRPLDSFYPDKSFVEKEENL